MSDDEKLRKLIRLHIDFQPYNKRFPKTKEAILKQIAELKQQIKRRSNYV